MAFERICILDDVPEGEMASFVTNDGTAVLPTILGSGDVKAYQAYCPHQQIQLAAGRLEGGVLTCVGHMWQFDVATGAGIDPTNWRLAEYPVRVDGDAVLVDVVGVEPFQAGI